MTPLIEHPHFNQHFIPQGWARITTGDVIVGDQLLICTPQKYQFAPCVKKDGKNIDTMSSGTCRVESKEGLFRYKSVVIREITSNEKLFLNIMETNLPEFIQLTQSFEGTIAKDTRIFKLSLSSKGFLNDDVLAPSPQLKTIIENAAMDVFHVNPVFFNKTTEFYIKVD
jgi:hypothetical protein